MKINARLLSLAILVMPFTAFGAVNDPTIFSRIDTLWVLIAAILVFFMQAGFGMVEAGLVRAKNAVNVLTKNISDFGFAVLAYFMFGYAIMYGGDGPFYGDSGWFMMGLEPNVGSIPIEAFWLFQVVFAGAAATIVGGAVAERMKFISYMIYSFIISAVIYPVVGHWVWGGGWLSTLGFHDFAGGLVVHTVGGASALVAAWMLGPRMGRFNDDGSANSIGGHNLPLVTMGVFILWFGWYGFNAGSALGFGDPALVARVAMNTTLAPSVGGLIALLLSKIIHGKPDLTLALNGTLAGLVGIIGPCAVVGSGASIIIGGVAGVLVIYGMIWLDKLGIDDVVGAFPVHGIAGIWGILAVGIFGRTTLGANFDGLIFGGGFEGLGIQALGAAAGLGFTVISVYVMFSIIRATVGLRVSRETEIRGLDIDEHGLESYSGFQIFRGD